MWTLVGRLRGPGGPGDPHAWPLLAYLLTCCIYPLASSCAHTFSPMSTRARHICYFFDYAALSMYSLGKGGWRHPWGGEPVRISVGCGWFWRAHPAREPKKWGLGFGSR